MNRSLGTLVVVLAAVAVFVMLNASAQRALAPVRIDLSEGRMFTLTDASKRIARGVPERITLRLYFSKSLAQEADSPQVLRLGQRLEELLRAYARESLSGEGDIVVEVIDPEPFSEAEDDAVRYGVAGVPFGAGQSFYLGLVASNATTGREVISTFNRFDERYLEYEVSRVVHKLSSDGPLRIGLASGLPISGLPALPNIPEVRQRPWQILNALEQLFEVEPIRNDSTTLPPDIDALVLIHPKGLNNQLLYEIDQYLMRGGSMVVFADPLAENDIPLEVFRNPNLLGGQDRSSLFEPLLSTYGAPLEPGVWVGDLSLSELAARRNPVTGQVEQVRYLVWMNLSGEQLNGESAVTGQLGTLRTGSMGVISELSPPPEGVTRTRLLTTTEGSKLYDIRQIEIAPNPDELLEQYAPSGAVRTTGVLLEGTFPSAYPEGRPEPLVEEGDEAPPPPPDDAPAHLTASAEPGRVVVIADSDMLSDPFWVQLQSDPFTGRPIGYQQTADNASLIVNAIESVSGEGLLTGVRARNVQSRPFGVVQELAEAAEQRFRQRQTELQERLTEAQQRILQLQAERPEGDTALLSAAQAEELERVRQEEIEARAELREVQFELNKDIDALGSRVKLINIALVPAIVAILAVALGWIRLVRRRADRVRAAEAKGGRS
ncbi:MAG: Gldg family protein [Planctomycetota bacterium]